MLHACVPIAHGADVRADVGGFARSCTSTLELHECLHLDTQRLQNLRHVRFVCGQELAVTGRFLGRRGCCGRCRH